MEETVGEDTWVEQERSGEGGKRSSRDEREKSGGVDELNDEEETGIWPVVGNWPETGIRPEKATGETGNWPGTGIRPEKAIGETGSRPEGKRELEVASIEEDEIFGKMKGYPTERRPIDYRRSISTVPEGVVNSWFEQSPIRFGADVENNNEQRQAARRLMYTWKDLFITDTARMTGTDLVVHTIPTYENAVPVRAKSKLYTPRERQWMEENIPKLLEAKIIDHSFSPWCHRTKFVPKKDGDLRMVHIYCPINDATIPNAYPMRRVEPVLNNLMQPGHRFFFQADAANGYWAVPLVENHAYKTAFDTHMGQFHYLRMGQGLAGAPQTYSRMKDLFAGPIPSPNPEPALNNTGIPGAFEVFVDDDYGAHKTFWDQYNFLHEWYLPRLAWAGLTIKPRKSGFFLHEIEPLGLRASRTGLRPSGDKVRAIRDYPVPQNLDEVNKFLYMTTYLRRFIPGRADLAMVMKRAATLETMENWQREATGRRDKTGKPIWKPRPVIKWEWGEPQQKAFEAIKEAIVNNATFGGKEDVQYHLMTDASKTGIGGVLSQLPDCPPGTIANARNRPDMRIILFISRRLEPAETRYSNTEREALAIVRCLGEVKWLVHGSPHPVKVYTDHSALTTLLRQDDAHGRLGKWQVKLSEYDLEYVHIPGSQNQVADGLSRMPARYFGVRERDGAEEVGTAGDRRMVARHGEGGKQAKLGNQKEDMDGEEIVVQGGREESVSAVESLEGWEKWLGSGWYRGIVVFLLQGSLEGERLTERERRRIRGQARRFRLHQGEARGLFYVERGGKTARCAVEEEVDRILESHHNEHGHFAGRMLNLYLLGKVYWPTRTHDTHQYARSCLQCQQMGPLKPSAGNRPIVQLRPMDMVGLDFIGPITPASETGNQYIIILVDYFTRHLFADAAPRATGVIARGLIERVARLTGWPLAVYTDNGTHFTGTEFHQVLIRNNVKHFPAPRQHPQSVGLSERYVQLVMSVLRKRVQTGNKALWDTLLDDVVSSINTRVLRVHGRSPAELLFGFTPRHHGDQTLDDLVTLGGLDQAAYGLRLAALDEARDLAGGVFTIAADAKEQNSTPEWTPLKEGDLVLVRNFEVAKHLGRKLDAQWEGPFRLVDVSRHQRSGRLQDLVTGEIVKARKGGLNERTHVNDMKLFYARGNGLPHDTNLIDIDTVRTAADWEPGERNGESLGGELAGWQAFVF